MVVSAGDVSCLGRARRAWQQQSESGEEKYGCGNNRCRQSDHYLINTLTSSTHIVVGAAVVPCALK